jgi:hypothetical protein
MYFRASQGGQSTTIHQASDRRHPCRPEAYATRTPPCTSRDCRSRRLDCIQFLCSQAHIPAGWHLETRLFTSLPLLLYSVAESESYVTTDGQPASLSWNKAPFWGLRPDLYYLCDSYGLVLVGRPL